uniref:hypothetical protein n=1 Tax=Agathobacter sp. TaxID=2021311 RepID=UPI004055AD17
MEDFLKGNPLLNGMDPLKLQFIMNFAAKEKPASLNQAMPFLMANMNQAKKQNIRFSDAEIRLIAEILTKDLPEEEKNKVKKIMAMMGK